MTCAPRSSNVNFSVRISKSLSYILRHGARKEGLPIRMDGYLPVSSILNHQKFRMCALQDIVKIVETNDKQRFSLQDIDGVLHIRANQGHSMSVEVEMEKITNPALFPTVIHGTYFSCWNAIKKSGLQPMGRQFVHMAKGYSGTGAISGLRKNAELLIFINLDQALADNIDFFISSNEVILAPLVPPKYFSHVIVARDFSIHDMDFPTSLPPEMRTSF